MPTKKIADLPALRGCQSPQHRPPPQTGLEPGIYEHTCPECGAQIRFRVDPPIGLADPGALRATGVTLQADPAVGYGTLPGERDGADQQRAGRLPRDTFQAQPIRNWLPPLTTMSPEAREHLRGALDALKKAREDEVVDNWAWRLAPVTTRFKMTPPKEGEEVFIVPRHIVPGHIFVPVRPFGLFGEPAAVTAIRLKEIEELVRHIHDPNTTCAAAVISIRRRTEIINAWCAATGGDEVAGGPFEHDLRGTNPHTGEPALAWVVNGDVLETPPIEGPAAASREWVRRFGKKEAL